MPFVFHNKPRANVNLKGSKCFELLIAKLWKLTYIEANLNKGTLLIISFIGNFNKLTISFEELLPFAQFCARDTRHLTFKLIEGNAYLRIHFEYFYFYVLFKARALRYPTRGIFQENRSPPLPLSSHVIIWKTEVPTRERRFGPLFQKTWNST